MDSTLRKIALFLGVPSFELPEGVDVLWHFTDKLV